MIISDLFTAWEKNNKTELDCEQISDKDVLCFLLSPGKSYKKALFVSHLARREVCKLDREGIFLLARHIERDFKTDDAYIAQALVSSVSQDVDHPICISLSVCLSVYLSIFLAV